MIFDCINDEKDWFLHLFQFFFVYLQQNNHRNMSNNQRNVMLNRLKAALAGQGKTSRWLSEQLGKSENTVSRWCANKVQPSIQQLNEIASVLDVDVRSLITSTKSI
jgi:ribosome-binding protein aMBF1 (putative translation factor)